MSVTTAIAAGQAVRHRTRRDLAAGRVRHIVGGLAVVTWVRRFNKSAVRLENLEPIPEAELAARVRDWQADPGQRDPMNDENRRFLLGDAAAQGNGCS